MNLAISFSLLLRPLSFTFAPSSLSPSFFSFSLSSFVSSVRAVVIGDRPSGWFSGLFPGIITLDTKIADNSSTIARCILLGKNVHCVDVISLRQHRLVLLACSILAINFFLLPSSSRFLPISLTSLSFSLFLTDCITLCRRQAVWPVYSSVASLPLSFSLCPSPSLSFLS